MYINVFVVGSTALFKAAESGHTSIVALLLRYGAAVDIKNNSSYSAAGD